MHEEYLEFQGQGGPFSKKFVETMLNKVMSPPDFPVRYTEIKANIIQSSECLERMETATVTCFVVLNELSALE